MALVLFSGMLSAQPPPGGPPRGGREALDRAVRDLGLNDQQQMKANEILEAHHQAMRKLHDKARSGELDREAMRTAHRKQTDEFLKQMKTVLTEEQFRKLSDSLPRGPRPGPGGPGRDRPRPDQPDQPAEKTKPETPAAGIQWFATWESGLKEAGSTGRPILLVSAAPHCAGVPGTW
jgi:hypothetical protein